MRYALRIVFLLLLFFSVTACVSQANLADGINSFRAQDYRRAFIRLKPEALKGQPDAQYAVGYMYYYGKGVVEDRKKALFWINAAAEAGQIEAQQARKILGCSVK